MACRRAGVAVDQPLLVLDDAGHRVGDVAGVLPPVEGLDLLDRVGLPADPHRLADDGQQVDEPPGAQQLVELGLADAVPPGEPLERADLVGGVVVDVHAGSARQASTTRSTRVLDHAPLLRAVVRPQGGEAPSRSPRPARYSSPWPSPDSGSPSKSR
jgi:hypothetical protein